MEHARHESARPPHIHPSDDEERERSRAEPASFPRREHAIALPSSHLRLRFPIPPRPRPTSPSCRSRRGSQRSLSFPHSPLEEQERTLCGERCRERWGALSSVRRR
ncbi:unnamed protein product [Urochloa humidicola]